MSGPFESCTVYSSRPSGTGPEVVSFTATKGAPDVTRATESFGQPDNVSPPMSAPATAKAAWSMPAAGASPATQRPRAEQLAPTPLEVPATEWMPAAASVDFADTTARGPVRSRVAHEGRRRTGESADATRLRRDEDSSISGPPPAPRRVWPWVVAGVVTVVVVAAVVALLWAGLR